MGLDTNLSLEKLNIVIHQIFNKVTELESKVQQQEHDMIRDDFLKIVKINDINFKENFEKFKEIS